MSSKTIILSSGGTGGHLFPACALAEELIKRGYEVILITDYRCKNFLKNQSNINSFYLDVTPLKKGFRKKIIALYKIFTSSLISLNLLRKYKPAFVVGFGGYPTLPVLLAAKILGIDIALHEQNSIIGKVNKYFASSAKIIATAFDHLSGISKENKAKTAFTGNPVLSKFKKLIDTPYPSINQNQKINLLVIGGSQGASVFTEVMPEAIAKLPEDLRKRIKITQQCRDNEVDQAQAQYQAIGVEAEISPFFCNIEEKMAETHLLICRSGASTLAELTVLGRPAIFVPYPYSAGNHQMYNALTFVDRKAGWLIPQDIFEPNEVAKTLEELLNQPELLQDAAKEAKLCYPDAAVKLADILTEALETVVR